MFAFRKWKAVKLYRIENQIVEVGPLTDALSTRQQASSWCSHIASHQRMMFILANLWPNCRFPERLKQKHELTFLFRMLAFLVEARSRCKIAARVVIKRNARLSYD